MTGDPPLTREERISLYFTAGPQGVLKRSGEAITAAAPGPRAADRGSGRLALLREAALRIPEINVALKVHPELRRRLERPRELDSHFCADRALARHDAADDGRKDVEPLRQCALGH